MFTFLTTLLAGTTTNPLGGSTTIKTPGGFQPGSGTDALAGGTPLELFFSALLGFFTIIGGLMFLVYFITGALSWISSSGDKSKMEHARSQLIAAATGLIIVVLTQVIIGIAGPVLGVDILNPATMLQKIWL